MAVKRKLMNPKFYHIFRLLFTYLREMQFSSVIVIYTVVQWSEFLATDREVWVRFPALTDFLRSTGSGTGSPQPCEYN
jgi:hypothetical protein